MSEFSSGKPALVFCSSRKGTSEAAAHLAREAARQGGAGSTFVRDAGQRQRLAQAAAGLKNSQLRECIQAGVGFHHAAVEPEERAGGRADGWVNGPGGVAGWRSHCRCRVSGNIRQEEAFASMAGVCLSGCRLPALQMVGRAGRPQYDTEGVAVIMTQKPVGCAARLLLH